MLIKFWSNDRGTFAYEAKGVDELLADLHQLQERSHDVAHANDPKDTEV